MLLVAAEADGRPGRSLAMTEHIAAVAGLDVESVDWPCVLAGTSPQRPLKNWCCGCERPKNGPTSNAKSTFASPGKQHCLLSWPQRARTPVVRRPAGALRRRAV